MKNSRTSENLSWLLIALGAISVGAAYLFFTARFVAVTPATLGHIMSRSEAAFLLFPYLGLAYLRLYAAETLARQRVIAVAAALLLVSGLALSVALIDDRRDAAFNFYFHSLVGLALQSLLTLAMVGPKLWSWWENKRPSTEALALLPLLAALAMFMSMLSMKWTEEVIDSALMVPYVLLALDGFRRLVCSLWLRGDEEVATKPLYILQKATHLGQIGGQPAGW